jgi:hypothetical protein
MFKTSTDNSIISFEKRAHRLKNNIEQFRKNSGIRAGWLEAIEKTNRELDFVEDNIIKMKQKQQRDWQVTIIVAVQFVALIMFQIFSVTLIKRFAEQKQEQKQEQKALMTEIKKILVTEKKISDKELARRLGLKGITLEARTLNKFMRYMELQPKRMRLDGEIVTGYDVSLFEEQTGLS